MLKKIIEYYKEYKLKLIFILFSKILEKTNIISRLRLIKLKLNRNIKHGSCIYIGQNIDITKYTNIKLGRNIYIGSGVIIELNRKNKLSLAIGDNTWISHHTHIQSNNSLSIGSNVLIGEFVSIRDTSHNHELLKIPVRMQNDLVGKIIIEDNVWIGRGSIIFSDGNLVTIGANSIIGANSVVKKSISKNTIWAGAPAKQMSTRE